MELRLLGAVEVWADESPLDLGPAKWRAVLAALAITPRRAVPLDVLVERVWGGDPPGNPTATLYPYITRLRNVLRPVGVGIVSRGGGYMCDVPPECVDVVRFREGVGKARELTDQPDPDRSTVTTLLREALANWRGMPLADLSGDWVTGTREALDRERLAALVLLAENQSYAGRLAELADDLLAAAADYPLSEPLAGYLIRALAAAGRRAEALDHYANLRELLVEQFGEEPGEELRDLHVRVLRRDPALTEPTPPAPASNRVVPRQLPTVARHFVGRSGELAKLDELAGQSDSTEPGLSIVLSAISGTAGIGKTATAVYWAHQSAQRFPDGQLYVNLRGFDPSGSPVSPTDAVRGFLDGLGVPPEQIPHDMDARTALYRSLVADRRMLVVLDNARDVEQVRPLLPGGSGCLTLVTSRNRLTGLIAEHGAHPITLDLLEPAEAERLLARRLGADRVAVEPEAVTALVEHCARLPLALTIAAAQAALDPTLPLSKLAAELADARERLDTLDTDDPLTTVRAVFSWSYSAQSDDVGRLFRLLGSHPGPDISVAATASLAAVSVPEASSSLAELCQANLLTEHAPSRYTFHDLLRTYATELAETHDTESDRRAATRRMLDHYLHTAYSADQQLDPHRDTITLPPLSDDVTVEALTDREQALAWFVIEHPVLLDAIQRAADVGLDSHAWALAWTLVDFLDRRGHRHDWASTQETALKAARRMSDRAKQARSHRYLANAYAAQGRLEDAHGELAAALELCVELQDSNGQAHCHRALCWILELQTNYEAALDHAERALALFHAAGNRAGEADGHNAIGWYHAHLGNYHETIRYCRQALALQEELGDRYGQAAAWDSLGYGHQMLGEHTPAIDCYRRSIELLREFGGRRVIAEILIRLGETHQADGDVGATRRSWQEALEILDELELSDSEKVREKLASLDTS